MHGRIADMGESVRAVTVQIRYDDDTTQVWTGTEPRINRRNSEWDLMISWNGSMNVEVTPPAPQRDPDLPLSPDEWWVRHAEHYEESRDHGADKDSADYYADNQMERIYGPCPEGPTRPVGPWLQLVPDAYDLTWHPDYEIRQWGPWTEPYPALEPHRREIEAAALSLRGGSS